MSPDRLCLRCRVHEIEDEEEGLCRYCRDEGVDVRPPVDHWKGYDERLREGFALLGEEDE
jgi:hypothetical protein